MTVVCRTYLAEYDWIYALMPDSWRYRKLCNLVHKFSMGIIKTRKAELKKKKVCALVSIENVHIASSLNWGEREQAPHL